MFTGTIAGDLNSFCPAHAANSIGRKTSVVILRSIRDIISQFPCALFSHRSAFGVSSLNSVYLIELSCLLSDSFIRSL
jgi:hypothetical protein